MAGSAHWCGRWRALLLAVGVGLAPATARAILADVSIAVDMFGINVTYTFEVRDRAGTVLDSGTVAAGTSGSCLAAAKIVAAINPTPADITITNQSPGICTSTDGGDVRVLITLCLPVELAVCSGGGPCSSGDVLGPAPKSVGNLTFTKSTSPVLSPGDIGHVVVLMMENRSFDHSLGWVPNANAMQSNTYNTRADGNGTNHSTFPLAPDYQGCDYKDPNHSYEGGRCEWNGGDADGWLFDHDNPEEGCSTGNDVYSIGYYQEDEAILAFYSDLAAGWLVLDNYFAPVMAGTWPNKIYQYAADTDRLATGDLTPADFVPECKSNSSAEHATLPTIFDLLDTAGKTARYYYTDVPLVALWGTKYQEISKLLPEFFADAANGTLPDVAFIDPQFLVESRGTSRDDHPKADIRAGQSFMNDIYQALVSSDNWNDTVFVINHDEWGGFFDHVDPRAANGGQDPPTAPCQAKIDLDEPGLRGFRVPAFVMSPWAPRGHVDGGLFDHASILRMIEWNWGLGHLTVRDQNAHNLAEALCATPDQSKPTVAAPDWSLSPACMPIDPGGDQWAGLYFLAADLGFDVPPYPARPDVPALSAGALAVAAASLLAVGAAILRRRRRGR